MASSKGQNRTSRERPGGNCAIQQEGNAPGTITRSCRWRKVIGRFPRLVFYSKNVSNYTGILVWMVSLRAFIEYIGMMINNFSFDFFCGNQRRLLYDFDEIHREMFDHVC